MYYKLDNLKKIFIKVNIDAEYFNNITERIINKKTQIHYFS